MDETTQAIQELGGYIESQLPNDVLRQWTANRELHISVRPEGIVRTLKYLRTDSNCLFEMLVDVCGVDYPDREERFEVVYNLLSLRHNQRVRIKIAVAEDIAVPSVVGVFPSASWFERECWDMFGIFFSGHPDMRRLLTDYGFDGHPFRKDFPLTGYVEVRYDDEERRVVYEPVKLTQAFRSFDFLSPWETMTRPLPGDEKAITEGES
jgi:NADH-quinone oxidoreductase subunit C